MRALVLTDLHLYDKIPGFLEAQTKCLFQIFNKERYHLDTVILCGDITMKRKPDPVVLLALKDLIDTFNDTREIYLLRGNHDSDTKADDGVTYLSLFRNKNTKVIIHSEDTFHGISFIPHYENEERIKKELKKIPKSNFVIGHFGYDGCYDRGDTLRAKIKLSDFRNPTLLGHIHTFSQQGNVTFLGTQYTTSWREAPKNKYYAILNGNYKLGWNLELKAVTHGPRFLSVGEEEINDLTEYINNPEYTTYLRVYTSKFMGEEIKLPELNVKSVEICHRPIISGQSLSDYRPESQISVLDDSIINKYLDEVKVDITKEDLLKGLEKIKAYTDDN